MHYQIGPSPPVIVTVTSDPVVALVVALNALVGTTAWVGAALGAAVGALVGAAVGALVGAAVGALLGAAVGALVAATLVGALVGDAVGAFVGEPAPGGVTIKLLTMHWARSCCHHTCLYQSMSAVMSTLSHG